MSKPRKMLCDLEAPYTQSLMRLIETQSKATLANWALDYAERHYLPIYAAHFPQDSRPREALAAARDWLAGRVKLPALKPLILAAHAAAREAEAVPPAQAAARAIAQAASTIHSATHALGIAFYGAAAQAYQTYGTQADPSLYEQVSAEECARLEAALRTVAMPDEPHSAKVNWRC